MGIVVIGSTFVDIKGYPDSQYIPAGRTRLCYFCAQQDNITTVVTDGG